eukprot:753537-Hanusia_phi.AAC.3
MMTELGTILEHAGCILLHCRPPAPCFTAFLCELFSEPGHVSGPACAACGVGGRAKVLFHISCISCPVGYAAAVNKVQAYQDADDRAIGNSETNSMQLIIAGRYKKGSKGRACIASDDNMLHNRKGNRRKRQNGEADKQRRTTEDKMEQKHWDGAEENALFDVLKVNSLLLLNLRSLP